jgi:hypothetical protein
MKSASRIVGWSLVALGGVSIFVGVSPLFPIYLEAFVLGGAFFAAGAWVLAGKDLRDTIRRGLRAARQLRRSSRVTADRAPGGVALLDPLLPVRILKLARGHGGLLTVAQVAMELNVPLDQAQAGLDECVRAGNALPDFDIPRGHAVYRFPEFTEPDTPRLSN